MDFDIEGFVKKYDVHPETVTYLEAAAASGAKPYYEIGVDAARQYSIERNEGLAGKVELEGSEREIFVPSKDVAGGIPVTVYKPKACKSLPAPTVLVYFHGGGNVIGCRKTHETVCKILARDTPCIVLTVEYRLAPEYKFPANNDDAKCVVEWVSKNKAAVGGADESKLGVSGDSAGGRLAAVVCHEAHQIIDFAVLIYPNVNTLFTDASVKEFPLGPVLPWKIIEWEANRMSQKQPVFKRGGKHGRVPVHINPVMTSGLVSLTIWINAFILVYPNVSYNSQYPSISEFDKGPVLSRTIRAWFMSNYIKEEEKSSPRASVIRQKEFSYLPPTLIIVAELDPLRDGCYAYYDILKKAGVDVKLKTIKGVPHAFWGWPAMFKTTCQEAYDSATEFIKAQM